MVFREPAVISEEWEFSPLMEDRFAIVCRSKHRLAHQRNARWTELERALWLALLAGLGVHSKLTHWLSGISRRPLLSSLSSLSLCPLADSQSGEAQMIQ